MTCPRDGHPPLFFRRFYFRICGTPLPGIPSSQSKVPPLRPVSPIAKDEALRRDHWSALLLLSLRSHPPWVVFSEVRLFLHLDGRYQSTKPSPSCEEGEILKRHVAKELFPSTAPSLHIENSRPFPRNRFLEFPFLQLRIWTSLYSSRVTLSLFFLSVGIPSLSGMFPRLSYRYQEMHLRRVGKDLLSRVHTFRPINMRQHRQRSPSPSSSMDE